MNKYHEILTKILSKGKEQHNKKGNIKYLLNQSLELKPIDLLELFEGHGLLSHTIKQHYPNAKVVYNDYDNYRLRLQNVAQTNKMIADIRLILDKSPKDKFMEIENLIKNFEEKFDRKNMDALLSDITVKTEKFDSNTY